MVTDPQNDTDDAHDRWIPDDEWETIVANVPLVSVDLVIDYDGGVLLGKRENDPAKDEWFVPGGTVFNGSGSAESPSSRSDRRERVGRGGARSYK
jgi:colanic acid biosynthesis protein WcaH